MGPKDNLKRGPSDTDPKNSQDHCLSLVKTPRLYQRGYDWAIGLCSEDLIICWYLYIFGLVTAGIMVQFCGGVMCSRCSRNSEEV